MLGLEKGQMGTLWKKYRLALLVVLAGVLLMLLPSGSQEEVSGGERGEAFSLENTEARMEETLRSIQGTGKLRLMLTLQRTSRLRLAEDTDEANRDGEVRSERNPLTLRRGGGEDVVVTEQEYPVYQGAVVVTEGADDPRVCLSLTEAVCALTGLPSDRVSIVKWKS